MRIKNNRSTTFFCLLIIICFCQLSFKTETTPALTVTFKDGLLSLEAKGVKVEDIFMSISEKCKIEIRHYGNVFPPDPVNIRFSDLELEEGIKRIIKFAGIKNHSMLFREVNPGNYQIYAIDFLGEGKASHTPFEPDWKLSNKLAIRKQTAGYTKKIEDSTELSFEEKIEEFKDKYEWENDETQELAEHLLNRMPERFRDAGLTKIMKGLDKSIESGDKDKVDEEMFLKIIEESHPPQKAHKVMSHIKKNINEFKGN